MELSFIFNISTKSRIAPPNGNVFTTRVSDVNRISNKQDIQSIILNESF